MHIEFYLFSSIFLIAAFAWFAAVRLLTYLHIFQQEEYDDPRFRKWIWDYKVFDKKVSGILLVLGLAHFFLPPFVTVPLTIITLGAFAIREPDPRKTSKKKLSMTDRAKRIYMTALVVCILPALLFFLTKSPLLMIALVQFIPLSLGIAVRRLQPGEDKIQAELLEEARNKMNRLSPTVIGITGSYGKTSIKHILGHILKMHGPTLMTPGSVNTPMGITRIIREELTEEHQYFIVEMGAYGPGSITRLCDLTPPDMGIISAIGHAHYERFKSLETVAETKFELARAVVRKNGNMIVEEKTLKFPYTKTMQVNNAAHFIVCGDARENPLIILNVYQAKDGVEVKVRWKGKAYTLKSPLYGSHHGENMALAFAAACTLGLDPASIITALKSVPQIRHRLEVKRTQGAVGAVIIDDAYNSNPRGFRAALDLLTLLSDKGKYRRILITPGMVELGSSHDNQHAQIGEYAAANTDIVLAVNPTRIQSFVDSFEKNKREDQSLLKFDTFKDAENWVNNNMRTGDIILIENDLPDLYERVPKL